MFVSIFEICMGVIYKIVIQQTSSWTQIYKIINVLKYIAIDLLVCEHVTEIYISMPTSYVIVYLLRY